MRAQIEQTRSDTTRIANDNRDQPAQIRLFVDLTRVPNCPRQHSTSTVQPRFPSRLMDMHVLLYSKQQQCTQSTPCNTFPCVGETKQAERGVRRLEACKASISVNAGISLLEDDSQSACKRGQTGKQAQRLNVGYVVLMRLLRRGRGPG